jgi:hypothetical protein
MRRLHFGLGKETKMEKAIIEWPSGKTQTIDSPKPGEIRSVKEEQ